MVASNGRYGPYIKCGAETRSLPNSLSPVDVTLEDALALLAQPKTGGRRAASSSEPLRTFPPSPTTGEPIRLLDGRYGPYVTDSVTNASLPKGTAVEELTFDQAVQLLADREAGEVGGVRENPSGRRRRRPRGAHARLLPRRPEANQPRASGPPASRLGSLPDV